jgi:hypothetical protein
LILETLGVGVFVALVLALLRTPPELLVPGAFKDDAVYLSLGRSIAEGRGYHSIYLPSAPIQVKYPPGLPLLYALLWTIFDTVGGVFMAAGVLSAIATAGAAATIWYVARSRLGVSAIVGLPLVIGPFLFDSAIEYYTLPISESWYVLLWALIILVALRVSERANRTASRDALVLGILIAAAMLVRTQAVALLAGVLVTMWLVGRRREAMMTGVVAIVPVAVWQAWLIVARASGASLSTLPDETAYLSFVPDGTPLRGVTALLSGVWINVREYIEIFAPYLSGRPAIGATICLAIVAMATIGAWKVRRTALAIPFTVAASVSLTLLWPWTQDRLLLPVLPFVGCMAAVALELGASRLRRTGVIVGAGVFATVVAIAVRQQARLRVQAEESLVEGRPPAIISPRWVLPRNSRLLLIEALWISKHARPDDRLLAASPGSLFLQTGRVGISSSPAESRLVPSAYAVPGRFLAKAITDDGISLVLLEAPDELNRDVGVVRQACPNAFHLDGQAIGGWPSFLRVVDTACIARAFR